jgi:hypothetical protein
MPTLSGWEVHDVKRGFVEDSEDRKTPLGQHKCKITYSRRQTLSMRLVALTGASVHTYTTGGTVASGVFTLADGSTATAWDIQSAEEVPTRGPMEVNLSLIQQGDMLAVS